MRENQALAAFGALSNKDRLAMIRLLVAAGPSGLSAGEIAQKTGAAPSRASFHLAALSDAGLVTVERASRSMIYRASFEGLGALVGFLMEDCCANDPAVLACCPPTRNAR